MLLPGYYEKRNYDRFGIDILKKNFSVKTLDCTAWRNPELWKKYSKNSLNLKDNVVISSKKDLLNLLKNNNPDIIIDFMVFDKKANWIIKKMKKNNKNLLVYVDINNIPNPTINIKKSLKKLFTNPYKILISLFILLANKYYYLTKAKGDLSIVGGLCRKKLNTKKVINAHSLDYDIYLKIKDKEIKTQNSYAVFLDEDMANHPDYINENVKPPIDEDEYYSTLINFLKKFEAKTNLKIKFALHPRAKYSEETLSKLKGIDYLSGSTAELVKNSKIVLLHCSTSLSYAILFKKPTVFLTSKKLKSSWIGPRIDNFAKTLNDKPIYIEEDFEKHLKLDNLFHIDEKKYQDYIDQYLKVPNSPNEPFWEIVTDFIKKNDLKKIMNNA